MFNTFEAPWDEHIDMKAKGNESETMDISININIDKLT